jgi:hypothetical protein
MFEFELNLEYPTNHMAGNLFIDAEHKLFLQCTTYLKAPNIIIQHAICIFLFNYYSHY